MKLKVGRIVKLKNTEGWDIYAHGEYAEIFQLQGNKTAIRFIKNGIEMAVANSKIEVVKWTVIKKIADLKEGNIVITNGDGSKKNKWIYGEVGEMSMDSEGKVCIYIWNNQTPSGSRGNKRQTFWKYSWKIKANNSKAYMIIVDSSTRDTRTMQCFECEEDYAINELEKCVDGEYYCEDCKAETFNICAGCDEQIESDNSNWSEGGDGPYCSECYESRYIHCRGCESEIGSGDSVSGTDGCDYCNECWGERFGTCEECDCTLRLDDLHYDEDESCYLCSECHSGSHTKVIHDYVYRPEPVFNAEPRSKDADKALYMGVELEVQREDYGRYADKFVEFLKGEGKDKYFYLKHDGSLHDKGFEIVSQPFTLKYAHKNIGFNQILEWLRTNKMESEESGQCGLHIHVSREFFEELDLTKLRIFFKTNKDKLMKLSKRGKEDGDYTYCRFEDELNWKKLLTNPNQEGRYWALNLNSSRETIEFRLFRGTLDTERFIAILQFVDAISHFVKRNGIASFIYGEGKYKENSWTLFIDWCRDENKYGIMLKYFIKEELYATV